MVSAFPPRLSHPARNAAIAFARAGSLVYRKRKSSITVPTGRRITISITVTFSSSSPADSSALILPLGKGQSIDHVTGDLSTETGAALKRAATASRFDGTLASMVEIFAETEKGARRIVVVGTGNGDDEESLEKAGGAAMGKLLTSGETALTFDARSHSADSAGSRMAFGALQRSWRLDSYRTKAPAKTKPSVKEMTVVAPEDEAAGWDRYQTVY
ncbi:MAG: M17 family peptidase N-terminal domain-containing protein, partial [Parasphingopyxis sp.]